MARDPSRSVLSSVLSLSLVVAGLSGAIYASRAALAQRIYFDEKFLHPDARGDGFLEHAEQAQQLYPLNYRLCAWVTQAAWDRYSEATGDDRKTWLNHVDEWSQQALLLNPYPRDITESRRKYLEVHALKEATTFWARYVEWNFWDPYNHAVLIELHVRAGHLEEALAEMKWVRDTPFAGRATDEIRALVKREFTKPSATR